MQLRIGHEAKEIKSKPLAQSGTSPTPSRKPEAPEVGDMLIVRRMLILVT